MAVTGAILAGGKGRRIGGDKPERVLGGQTLLERATALVKPLCEELLVIGPRGIPDTLPGLGPLGGLLTALESARHERVLVLTVDMPLVPPGVLRRLIAADQLVVLAGPSPFPGLYSRAVLQDLYLYLEYSRRARDFAFSLDPWVLELSAGEREALECNVNTSEDLEQAERLLQARRSQPE